MPHLADERMRESLLLAREQGERTLILYNLGHMAALAVARKQGWGAAKLKGAESRLRELSGIPLPPVYQPEAAETLAEAKTMLEGEAFIRALEAGRAMDLDEAMSYALQART